MSGARPGVSVLVVTYRHAPFVDEAVESALVQLDPNDEVVVVDDGSPDDTVERVRRIGDPRIVVLAQPHRGLGQLARTYNVGLSRCTGDLVGVLEGDDRWPPNKLAYQREAFADQRVVLSHGLYSVIAADGSILHGGVRPPLPVPEGAHDARPFIYRASYVMPVTALMRRDALSAIGGFHQLAGTSHCDYSTFLPLAENGLFHFRSVVVGQWRRHAGAGTYRLSETAGARAAMELALEARRLARGPGLPSPAEIRRSWADADARRAWQTARILLMDRRPHKARQVVIGALRGGMSAPLRIKLILALAASLVGSDVEWLARRAGRGLDLADVERGGR